jgi:hypothetical protein
VTVEAASFELTMIPGVSVFQDQTLVVGVKMTPTARVIGHITATGQRTNLVQPNVTSNTYNVTAKQMSTVLNDSTHHTLYDVLWRTPGITSGPSNGSPTIRGGTTTELGWEFEGVPIVDRTVGFYATELSTTGLSNVEVTTGGLTASQGGSNGGVINMVVKQGTYPTKADLTFGVNHSEFSNTIDYEYGAATPDNAWSWFLAGSIANGDNVYGDPGKFYYENIEGFDYVNAKDNLLNLKHTWGGRSQNALQFVLDNGVGLFRSSYGGAQGSQLVISTIDKNGNYILVPKYNGDAWYHWYNVNQLSFSHSFNDSSFLVARLAQSRNGYFFDELWAANRGEPCISYDGYYQDGSPPYNPVANCTIQPGPDPNFDFWGYGIYYQDRHTLQTISNVEYANQLNNKNQLKVGASYEIDNNFRKVADPTSTSFYNTFPDYYTVTMAPTYLYSTYLSDHYQSGRWVVEPGVRWDMEHYAISPVIDPTTKKPAYGSASPFNESFLSPRIGISYQAGDSDVFRASYGHLGQFIGTAYAENYSTDMLYGNGPAHPALKPQVAKSYDFSWEHQFPNQVSMRLSPYWHNNADYVVDYRPPASIDPKKRQIFVNGGQTHTHGVEFGLSREVSQGLSTFFSFTYNDTRTNVVSALGPYFGGSARNDFTYANIRANNFVPANFVAPWSSNLALDWNRNGWEVDSNLTWATAFPYGNGRLVYTIDPTTGKPIAVQNAGTCATFDNVGLKCLSSAEGSGSFADSLRGPAWFSENLSVARRIGAGTKVGLSAYNLFNNITNPNLTTNQYYLNTSDPATDPIINGVPQRTNNWHPLPACPSSPQFMYPCFNSIYPAPNGVRYPANGYFRETSGQPRLISAWVRFDM